MKKRIISLAISVMVATLLSAQALTPMQLKQARWAVYEWCENYNAYLLETSRNAQTEFSSLFESPNAEIYNDLIASHLFDFSQINISAQEYKALQTEQQTFRHTYKLSSFQVLSEKYDKNQIHYILSFEKNIGAIGASPYENYSFPIETLNYNVHLTYDLTTETLLATYLQPDNLIEPYIIYHEGKINEKTTEHDIRNRAQSLNTPLVIAKVITPSISNKFREIQKDTLKNNFHLGASVGQSFAYATLLNQDFQQFHTQVNITWNVYIGYYRQLYLNDKHRHGLEWDIAFSQRNLTLQGNYQRSYPSIDPDGGDYLRLIALNNYEENIKRYALSITPIAYRYDYFFNSNLSLYLCLGATVSYDLMQHTDAIADAYYAGYYDWLFNVTLDQNGIYDFGSYNMNANSTETAFHRFSVDAFLGVGVQYFIPQTRLSIEGGIQYRGMVFNMLKTPTNFHLSERNEDYRSATNLLKSCYWQQLMFNVQINYNF